MLLVTALVAEADAEQLAACLDAAAAEEGAVLPLCWMAVKGTGARPGGKGCKSREHRLAVDPVARLPPPMRAPACILDRIWCCNRGSSLPSADASAMLRYGAGRDTVVCTQMRCAPEC